jgi:cyclase
MSLHRIALACILAAAPVFAQAPRYSVEKLADGVHAVLYNPELEVEGNTLIVINDDDVVVVDSNAGVTTAKMTIAEIRKLTPKPVSHVINTHWHDDHVMGNQAYADEYPGVKFVAHPLTRQDIVEHAFANNAYVIDLIAADIPRIGGYLQSGIGRDGKPLTEESRARTQLAYDKRVEMLADRKIMRAVPPTVDVADAMTLERGARSIQITFLGRGNTRGDLVVYLPKEKVVATGDLVVAPIPYATSVYAREWVQTLDRLMTMPATTVLPGHGPVMRDWTYVRKVKGALEQTIAAVAAAKKEGLTLSQTIERVQLPELRDSFLQGQELRRPGYEGFFRTSLVRNVWEELDADVMAAYAKLAPKKGDGQYALGRVTAYINEKDTLLVNVPESQAAARATIRALREITDKAVRYVVVTTTPDKEALAVLREVYTQAEIVSGRADEGTITVGDMMSLHRGAREFKIRRAASGDLAVEVTPAGAAPASTIDSVRSGPWLKRGGPLPRALGAEPR